MFFWNKFCGLIIFFFILSLSLKAQNSIGLLSSHSQVKNILLRNTSIFPSFSMVGTTIYSKKLTLLNSSGTEETEKNFSHFISPKIIPANFSVCDYGFFCRQELKVEKATNIPIRVRLGSLEQCNYYEGKP